MKQEVLVGQTDYTVLVLIRDDAGAPKTGLTEASIDIAYARVETDNDVTTTDVTPAALAALTTAHTDWGFEEVSATDHPGLYRLDIADAVFASGAWSAVVSVTGTGLDPCQIEFVLVAHSPWQAIADILTDTGTTLQAELDGIQADTEDIQSRLPAALVSGRIDASVGAMAANVLTATAINNDAITAAKIANAAIDAATFAADVDAEILSYIVDDATRIDASALNTASVTTIPAILVDTGTTLDGKLDTIDTNVDSILADTGTDGVVVAAASKTGYALSQAGLADFFDTDSGTTYASAVAGSVVAEIADNAGGSALTAAAIADAVWDEAQADHATAGSFGETATEIAAILVDTGTTLDGKIDTIDSNVDAILVDTGTTLDGKLDTVDTVVDAIKVQTDKLTFTVANQIDSNVQSINDVTITGDGQTGTEFGV